MSKIFLTTFILLMACSPKSEWTNYTPPKQEIFEKQFKLETSEWTVTQERYDDNIVSAHFRVQKDEKSVNNLSDSDILVTENSINVSPFNMTSESQKVQEVVDIMFLVDITGTMVELIESAKARLAEFVQDSRKRGYHTRMCISTFGDYTVKKCSRFFDNNPNDESTEAQVRELVSELAQLKAYRGNGKDPGWPDLDENPMGALIDASKAPWSTNSQRFVILVTDWGFLYSPNNQGTIGTKAPTMSQVNEAIRSSQMTVFAVTRTEHTYKGEALSWDGYNTPFQGEPGIVQSSGGEYFPFDKVLKGEITITSILERILDRVDTTYKISYVVDQVQGLDPTLAIDSRKVSVQLKNPEQGQVQIVSKLSSIPKGRPEYKNSWQSPEDPWKPNTLRVFVDNRELQPSEYSATKHEVTFSKIPDPGANIRFVFQYENGQKNLRLEPIIFARPVEDAAVTVYFNDVEAQKSDYVFSNTLEGHTTLTLNESVMDESDPYRIQSQNGLKVKVLVNCGGQTGTGFLKKSQRVECVVK